MIDLFLCVVILVFPVVATLVVLLGVAGPWQSPGPDPNAVLRAQRLLEQMLTENEKRELAVRGYLSVVSKHSTGREYRIWSTGGPVEVYDAGRYSMSLCVEPVVPLPPGDRVLMHKLLIEGQEEEYLRVANRLGRAMWLGRTGRRRAIEY